MNIDNQIKTIVQSIVEDIKEEAEKQVIQLVQTYVADRLTKINTTAMVESTFNQLLSNHAFHFPDNSIPGTALDPGNLEISGNNIKGGIISDFGSTGIDDKATSCQLSIFDETTVVENNLLTQNLTVKGAITVEGDLAVLGSVDESSPFYNKIIAKATENVRSGLSAAFFAGFTDTVFKKISEDGLDLNKITQNGRVVVDGSYLGSGILFSNLQKVGDLTELQVTGETFLSGTLYTTKNRVGVNTIEPTNALSVWDQEIELGFGKQSSNTAVIGTPRSQALVLSSNGKNNITLATDGSVEVKSIKINNMHFTTSSMPPSNDQPRGTVVFNENPTVGGPLGWVSLGDARWANFGIID